MRDKFVFRLRLIVGLFFICFVLVGIRLYFVQIAKGEEYSRRADRQYTEPQNSLFDRGGIAFEDKNGERIDAATVKSGFTIAINPNLIENPAETLETISNIIEIDEQDFLLRASKQDDPYEVISNRVSKESVEKLKEKEIEGLIIHEERWRYYPGGNIAAQTIGFVGFEDSGLTGRYGLERYYEDTLKRDEDDVYINFFAEVFSNVSGIFGDEQKKANGNLVLTIEPTVQAFLEDQLVQIAETWRPAFSAGIIINPQNGEVRAMAVNPNFDLNNFQDVEDTALFGNPLVEGVFEMGSIVKPFTMSVGIDTKAVTANTTYDDKGFLALDGGRETISNFDKKGRGVVSMQEVLNQSLNTGAAFVVSKTGNQVFADYLKKFGLGEETGIDLPGEVRGFLGNLDSPRDVEYATASFGQGIAMTPIATVRALSALSNGGRLITPHIVKGIENDLGLSKKIFYDQGESVIKPGTSEEITRMLVKAFDEGLLGGKFKMDRHSIATKTGTAQMADPINGGYYEDKFLHSFFGYFPAFDPEYLVFIFMEDPKNARYSSDTLSEPFVDTAKFLLSYYNVAPDR